MSFGGKFESWQNETVDLQLLNRENFPASAKWLTDFKTKSVFLITKNSFYKYL